MIVIGATVLGGVLGGSLGKVKPVYQGEFQLLTKPVTVEAEVVSSLNQSIDKKVTTTTTGKGFDGTKARMLYSPAVLQPVFDQLAAQYPGFNYDDLTKNIDIKAVPETEIVTVKYSDTDQDRVTQVLKVLRDRKSVV